MIYFMQAVDGGAVKIGFTDDLPTRHYHLERHYGRSLAILATMEGGREREAEIHAQFGHLRFGKTEQFRPASDLMAFIGRPLLVGANPDVIEAMPPFGLIPAVVLKDTPAYRDWLTEISETTLIPVASIVRDALAKWAADRDLPAPPTGPTKSHRRKGDRS